MDWKGGKNRLRDVVNVTLSDMDYVRSTRSEEDQRDDERSR